MAAAEPSVRKRRASTTERLVQTAKQVEAGVERAVLLLWDELPPWRRDNAYIHSGYRATSNSYLGSLASLGYLHNESVNIWTHLVGAVGFTLSGLLLHSLVAPRYDSATGADVVVFSCFFAGAFVCLAMSATFHTLSNHSPAVAMWGNKLDYTGIVFLILGSYVPALYYGLVCMPALMTVYLSSVRKTSQIQNSMRAQVCLLKYKYIHIYIKQICVLGLACLSVCWFEHFRTPGWRPYRALMFVGLGLSGVVPILHAMTTYGFDELDARMGLTWVILQGALYIFGAFLYAVCLAPSCVTAFAQKFLQWAMNVLPCARQLTRIDALARTPIPGVLRPVGKLAPDIPRLCLTGRRLSLVWHGQGLRFPPQHHGSHLLKAPLPMHMDCIIYSAIDIENVESSRHAEVQDPDQA
jgi:adiponectin receptor